MTENLTFKKSLLYILPFYGNTSNIDQNKCKASYVRPVVAD